MISPHNNGHVTNRCYHLLHIKKTLGMGWDDLGEWHWNMYNIIYEKVASPGSMLDSGCLGLVHWDDPEGWYGEGRGRRVQDGTTCIPVVDSCWYMAKPIHTVKLKYKITRKSLERGNTQDTYLTEMSLFIWNLNFTGDPLFHLATLLRASSCTIKSSLMEGGTISSDLNFTKKYWKLMRPAFTEEEQHKDET